MKQTGTLYTVACAAYVLGVTGLAVLLGLTGSGSTALWLVLFGVTAPCSFVLAPAAAVLMVGLSASFGSASSFAVQALMATLWIASWSGIAVVNGALMAPGPGIRVAVRRDRAQVRHAQPPRVVRAWYG